jgi:hypothetical protein
MASCINEDVASELELLAAMWSADELVVETSDTSTMITVGLAPMTAGDEQTQFLRCELQLRAGPSYPSEPPELALGSSRGLSDAGRASLLAELSRQREELIGEPALFALLEAGRTALTNLNTAGGECPICLGDLSDVDIQQVLRMPCYHLFHRQCVIEYCKSEISADSARVIGAEATDLTISCPECRADVPWTCYPDMQAIITEIASRVSGADSQAALSAYSTDADLVEDHTSVDHVPYVYACKKVGGDATRGASSRPEAFVRLHHLYQGNDEKEKPLLRLVKELGLDAVIYYGKPALLHIQGDSKDVDAFARTAKRRHITVTIDVAQRSFGPPISSGFTYVTAKKGSLNSTIFKEHLDQRCLGETAFTIIGS